VAKRALCVGINDYPIPGNDLMGCVNDANAWRALLVEEFGFPGTDVTVVTDAEATRQAMIDGLRGLIEGSSSGDVLVFTNSSHGSYIPDTSGDEETYDEVICPYDTQEEVLSDDDLRGILDTLPAGVSMTVISDSCHSGSNTRAAVNELLPPRYQTAEDLRIRFLNPALIPDLARRGPILADPRGTRPRTRMVFPESGMNHVLLSGCRDDEVSWDAKIEGTYHGAMSYHALKAIRDGGSSITYSELAERLQQMLDDAGYAQHPQLEGPDEAKRRQVFE
jgi:metacaspase-1